MASQLLTGLGLTSGVSGDDPPAKPYYGRENSIPQQESDLRDYLANLVGFGSKTMDKSTRNDYGRLVGMYGKPMADKIMNHVFIFNNRADIQKSGPADRLRAFYAIGSRDKELQALFNKAKAYGEGPVAGLNDSHNVGNAMLTGRWPYPPAPVAPALAQAIPNAIK